MTAIQKIIITLALTATVGTAGYQARQAYQLREHANAIRRQQAPLLDQIQQLQEELSKTTNHLASLLAENQQWKSNFGAAEIQRLQAELTQLQGAKAKTQSDPDQPVLDYWLNRVNQLKQYVEQHPDQGIPEFKFVTDREWLLIAAPEEPSSGWGAVLEDLKPQAEVRFAQTVEQALQNYAQANGGQFPSDLSQLQPYCNSNVEDILQQRYEIKPATILPASSGNAQHIKTDWVIAGKQPIASNSGDHIAIYTSGYSYFW